MTTPRNEAAFIGLRERVYIGSRKRTEKTAMAEAVREVEDWWAGIGRPDVRVKAVAVERKAYGGWVVTYERIR